MKVEQDTSGYSLRGFSATPSCKIMGRSAFLQTTIAQLKLTFINHIYEKGSCDMQTEKTQPNQAVAKTQGVDATAEPLKLQKRIGSTVYSTNVYLKKDATQTMDDIILRLIRNDAQNMGRVSTGKVAV